MLKQRVMNLRINKYKTVGWVLLIVLGLLIKEVLRSSWMFCKKHKDYIILGLLGGSLTIVLTRMYWFLKLM